MPNISTWTELNAIRNDENYLYNTYYLIADLKISDADYDGIGNAWSPLPNDYQGNFDGTGHYIEGLSNALFTTTNGATVQRLGLKDVSIVSSSEIGALIISAMSSNIVNCWATGTVTNNGSYPTGGLIGSTYYGTEITNCYCDVAVTSSNFDPCGGLVGSMQGLISGCFSVGVVTYNTEIVEYGGGLVGAADTQPTGCGWVTTTCAQAIGNVNGSYPGTVDYNETTEAPYYVSTHALYSSWDFVNTWRANTGALPTTNSIGLTPSAPVLTVSLGTDDSIGLSWTASTAVGGTIIGYRIDRALKSDSVFSVLVSNTGTTDVEYSDTTVETGVEYLYKVYGISYAGNSSASNIEGSIAKIPSVNFLSDGIETPLGTYHYFGDPTTNNSYRIYNASGTLKLQKRISGTWTDTSWASVEGTSLLLDQTNYQTIVNGIPRLSSERVIDADYQLVDKLYVDNILGDTNALVYRGTIDCVANPNYPAADAGHLYVVSGAGKIGGSGGVNVEAGDMCICNTDGTVSGDQSTVGTKWNIIQKNIDGAVTGPASSVSNHVVFFDGTTGKIIKDSGLTLSGTNTGDQDLSGYLLKNSLGAIDSDTLGLFAAEDEYGVVVSGYVIESGLSLANLGEKSYNSLTDVPDLSGLVKLSQSPQQTVTDGKLIFNEGIQFQNGEVITNATDGKLRFTGSGGSIAYNLDIKLQDATVPSTPRIVFSGSKVTGTGGYSSYYGIGVDSSNFYIMGGNGLYFESGVSEKTGRIECTATGEGSLDIYTSGTYRLASLSTNGFLKVGSSNGTISVDTTTYVSDVSGLVPYSGATGNVNLGSFSLTASNLSGTNTGDQDLSGLVPYTGATSDVALGAYDISATDASFSGYILSGVSGIDDNGAKVIISDADRKLGGAVQATAFEVLGSVSGGVNRLAHFDNNQSDTRTEVTFSNSGDGYWQNNFVSFMVHGPSFYLGNFYLPDIAGKTSDAGWSYLLGQGSNMAGLGFLTYNEAPMAFGTNALTRMFITPDGNVLIGTSTDNPTGYTLDGVTYHKDTLQNNSGSLLGGTVLISEAGSAATRQTHYGIPYALEIQFNSSGSGYSYPMGFKNLDGVGGEFAFTSFSGSVVWATAGTVIVENPKGAMGFCPSGDVRFTTNGWTATPSIIAKKVSDGNDKIGINTSAPDKALEVNLGTSSALRLTYNDKNGSASKYADFTVASTGATTITNTANIFTFGNGVADTDYTVNFTGTTNSGAFKWMEDEDYFQFSDDVMLPDNEAVKFGTGVDASIHYDGTNLIINPKAVGSGILDVSGTVQSDGYNASDGSAGATADVATLAPDGTTTRTIHFKNGLYTGYTDS